MWRLTQQADSLVKSLPFLCARQALTLLQSAGSCCCLLIAAGLQGSGQVGAVGESRQAGQAQDNFSALWLTMHVKGGHSLILVEDF